MEYPKIETLYNREMATRRVTSESRIPEFDLIDRWHVTEKIDGTNIRIVLSPEGKVTYGGRTDRAHIPADLVNWLNENLSTDKVVAALEDSERRESRSGNIILFGEGYGPKIQNGGTYRRDVSFRLFDVVVLTPTRKWWLNWENVDSIAQKLDVPTVPVLAHTATTAMAVSFVTQKINSVTAKIEGGGGCIAEGIVARTNPLLHTRVGKRVMWKLKVRDYPE